ncbi:S1 RNA-binding domain-containing protein [Candidatus Nomurabacteria bacterium]|nr:S1 RNA-binding domain-containing protein [Candidatus Nomurabacteria bacterium]
MFFKKSSKKDAPQEEEVKVEEAKASKSSAKEEKADKEVKSKKDSPMAKILNDSINPPSIEDIVEGTVIGIEKSAVYISLPPFGTGIIYGKEFIQARDVIRKLHLGDKVTAKVIEIENDEGYIELSLKEAKQALVWAEIEENIKNKTILDLPVLEANRGGLIMSWQGIQGFLPASQLKTEHYPRVTDGDKDKILDELKKLVGKRIEVNIIGATPKDGKLIFSEKNLEQKDKEKIVDQYKVGDEVKGEVTGMVDFGIFVKLEEGLEGLVHISEIDWALVENPKTLFKVGDKVKVKIIEIKDGKISLSIKALKENPWVEAGKKYKKDSVVKGVVIKFNKHGALASIEEGVAGLVHVSDFGDEEKLRAALELGKTYDFKINLFDPKSQKMTLSYVAPVAKK